MISGEKDRESELIEDDLNPEVKEEHTEEEDNKEKEPMLKVNQIFDNTVSRDLKKGKKRNLNKKV